MIRIHQKFNLRSYANDIALIRIPVSFFRFLFLFDFQPCAKQELSFRVVKKAFNQPVFPRGLPNLKNRDQFVSFPVGEAIFPGKTGCETVGWSRQEWKLLVQKDVPKSSGQNLTRRNNFASCRSNYWRKQVGKFFNTIHLLRLFYQYWNYSLTRELRAWIKWSQYRLNRVQIRNNFIIFTISCMFFLFSKHFEICIAHFSIWDHLNSNCSQRSLGL